MTADLSGLDRDSLFTGNANDDWELFKNVLLQLINNHCPLTSEENENLIPTQSQGFQIFGGSGSRLDGRSCEPSTSGSTSAPSGSRITQRGIPNYDYRPGGLKFLRMGNKVTTEHEDVSPKFKPFEGEGTKLKQSGAKTTVR
nr:unnamed protein product [Spirometra erinaceieuropaei]